MMRRQAVCALQAALAFALAACSAAPTERAAASGPASTPQPSFAPGELKIRYKASAKQPVRAKVRYIVPESDPAARGEHSKEPIKLLGQTVVPVEEEVALPWELTLTMPKPEPGFFPASLSVYHADGSDPRDAYQCEMNLLGDFRGNVTVPADSTPPDFPIATCLPPMIALDSAGRPNDKNYFSA
ncbi:hypothetical protein [Segniliparus rotundus]|nr:hypothetical protein [Segniliparus rotundus]